MHRPFQTTAHAQFHRCRRGRAGSHMRQVVAIGMTLSQTWEASVQLWKSHCGAEIGRYLPIPYYRIPALSVTRGGTHLAGHRIVRIPHFAPQWHGPLAENMFQGRDTGAPADVARAEGGLRVERRVVRACRRPYDAGPDILADDKHFVGLACIETASKDTRRQAHVERAVKPSPCTHFTHATMFENTLASALRRHAWATNCATGKKWAREEGWAGGRGHARASCKLGGPMPTWAPSTRDGRWE